MTKRIIMFGIFVAACSATQPGRAQESLFGETPEADEFAQCVVDKLQAKGLAGTGEANLDKAVFEAAYASCKPEKAVKRIAKRLRQMEPRFSADDAQTVATEQIKFLSAVGASTLLKLPQSTLGGSKLPVPPPIIIHAAPPPIADDKPPKEADAPNH